VAAKRRHSPRFNAPMLGTAHRNGA